MCVRVRVCVCAVGVGVWVVCLCGCVGVCVWVCGCVCCVGVWVCGCVGDFLCEFVCVWVCFVFFFHTRTHTHTHTHTHARARAHAHTHTHTQGDGSKFIDFGKMSAIFSRHESQVIEQAVHMDFKKGQGVCGVLLAVGEGVNIGLGSGHKLELSPGSLLVFSSNFMHKGGYYNTTDGGENGHLRLHMYVHWLNRRDKDDIGSIHHEKVRAVLKFCACYVTIFFF